MSKANIFTDDFRTNLPQPIKNFLIAHKIKLVFKNELNDLIDKKTRGANKFDKLRNELRYLCNPRITEEEEKKENENDVCEKLFLDDPPLITDEEGAGLKWNERRVDEDNKTYERTVRNIGPGYFDGNIENVLRTTAVKYKEFDIIVLVDSDHSNQRTKEEKVIGFLMTELGECRDADNVYGIVPSLNLICAPRKHTHSKGTETEKDCKSGSCGVIGRVLIYMYLSALKRKGHTHGILELANIYCNLKGLCLYSKFGFREDVSMKEPSCFDQKWTLSMVCELGNLKQDELDKALIDSINVNVAGLDPLCDKALITQKEKQQIMTRNRMVNHFNILDLQMNNVSVADIEDDIFPNKKPTNKKNAVKELGIASQKGSIFEKFVDIKPRTQRRQRPHQTIPPPPPALSARRVTARQSQLAAAAAARKAAAEKAAAEKAAAEKAWTAAKHAAAEAAKIAADALRDATKKKTLADKLKDTAKSIKKKARNLTNFTRRVTRSMTRLPSFNYQFKNPSSQAEGASNGLNSGSGIILHKRRRSTKKKYGW